MSWLSINEISEMVGGKVHNGNVDINRISIDSRTIETNDLFIALKGQRYDGHQYIENAYSGGASAVMSSMSLDIPLPWIQVNDTAKALVQFATSWRQKIHSTVVALTGSNGKTTTKDMLSTIVRLCKKALVTKGNLNNHIGVPLTILDIRQSHNCAVIEMGANHKKEIKALCIVAKPDIGMVLNAGSAHLEGFGSLDGVAEGKGEMYQSLSEEGIAIFNRDDDYYKYWRNLFKGKETLSFGFSKNADVNADLQSNGSMNLHILNESRQCNLQFIGRHNVMNAMAAACAATALKIDIDSIVTGLEQAVPPRGRLVKLSGKKEMVIIDDTYNANPSSLNAAIDVLQEYSGRRWLALGNMTELGTHAEEKHKAVAEYAKTKGVEQLLTIGELAKLSSTAFGNGGIHFESFDEMSSYIDTQASSDICLLVKGSRSACMDKLVTNLVVEK